MWITFSNQITANILNRGVHCVIAAPYEDWCRLSLGLPEEMAAAHAALETVFGAELAMADATAEVGRAPATAKL